MELLWLKTILHKVLTNKLAKENEKLQNWSSTGKKAHKCVIQQHQQNCWLATRIEIPKSQKQNHNQEIMEAKITRTKHRIMIKEQQRERNNRVYTAMRIQNNNWATARVQNQDQVEWEQNWNSTMNHNLKGQQEPKQERENNYNCNKDDTIWSTRLIPSINNSMSNYR